MLEASRCSCVPKINLSSVWNSPSLFHYLSTLFSLTLLRFFPLSFSLSIFPVNFLFHFKLLSALSLPPITMTDKASSQQTADALFLLDALQHVTSTVMVSLSLYSNYIPPSLTSITNTLSDQRWRDRSPKRCQSKHDPKALHNT